MASLYSAHLSPIVAFKSVYECSRSSRGTEIRALEDLTAAVAFVAALFAGLEAESVRLRAAGSICMVGGLAGARRGEVDWDYAFMKDDIEGLKMGRSDEMWRWENGVMGEMF